MASNYDRAKISKNDSNHSTPTRNGSMNRGNKRSASKSPSASSPVSSHITSDKEELRAIIQEIIKAEFSEMLTQFNEKMVSTMNNKLEIVKAEMREMINSMQFINNQFEDFERNQKATNEVIQKLELENAELKTSMGTLQARINNLEQQSRSNNLELQCMPEAKNENVYSIITQLGQVVNCDIQEKDILHCTRIAKTNPSSTRPRSLVVQLASPRLRDQLLASVIKFNQINTKEKLNCGHLGFTGNRSPVYVVEHLSPTNKTLHAATRIRAKEMHYKYVWVRNGRIFVRKEDGAEYILIKNMSSLSKII